jgi:hypothetical protein
LDDDDEIEQHPRVLAEGSHLTDEAEVQLSQEVRGLTAPVYFLEEENEDLRHRVAFVCRELEKTRAKIPATAFRTFCLGEADLRLPRSAYALAALLFRLWRHDEQEEETATL